MLYLQNNNKHKLFLIISIYLTFIINIAIVKLAFINYYRKNIFFNNINILNFNIQKTIVSLVILHNFMIY